MNLQDLQCESSISSTYLYIWWHTKLLWMFPQPSPATKYYMCCSVSQQSTTDNLWQCNISNITPLHPVLSVHLALNFAEKVSARFSWYTSRTSYASPTCSIHVVCAKVVHFVVDKRLLYSTFVRNQRRRSNWKYVMKDSKEKQISCIWETAKTVRWVIFKKWGRRRRRENSLITKEEAYLCLIQLTYQLPTLFLTFPWWWTILSNYGQSWLQ